MTNIVVPYDEIQNLIQVVLNRFLWQYNVTIAPADVDYTFIQPRPDTTLGLQLSDKVSNGHKFTARVYIQFYELIPELDDFRQEEKIDTGVGAPGNDVFVSYARMPRSIFPTLAKLVYVPPDDGGGTTPQAIVVTVSNGTLSSETTVGFSQASYTFTSGNLALLPLVISSPASEDISFHFATQDSTALSGVDYTASSGTTGWNSGFSTEIDLRVKLLAQAQYWNWVSQGDQISADTWNNCVQLSNNNCRILSQPGEPVGNSGPLPYSTQAFNFASQYLQDDDELYYEILITNPGESLGIQLQGNYIANLNNGLPYASWPAATYVGIEFNYNDADHGSSSLQLVWANNSGGASTSDSFTIAGGIVLPLRFHCIVNPLFGVKFGWNGNWYDINNQVLQTDPALCAWYSLTYTGYTDPSTSQGGPKPGVDYNAIAPLKYNFFVYATKYDDEYFHRVQEVIDITFPGDGTVVPQYLPQNVTAYTGVSYQKFSRHFNVNLTNLTPVESDIQFGNSTAQVNLMSLADYSYNKLVTNQDLTNLDASTIDAVSWDPYTTAFVPIIQWVDADIQSGLSSDLTNGFQDMHQVPFGTQLYPDIAIQRHIKAGLTDLFIDRLDLPMDPNPGQSFLFNFKTLLPFYQDPFHATDSVINSPDKTIHSGVPSLFYNGVYVDNNDLTFSYATMLRYYASTGGKLILTAVPPSNTDTIDLLPPLYLYFDTAPGNYFDFTSNNDGEVNQISMVVPYVLQNNEGLNDALFDSSFILYYTLDGSTPTTSSASIVATASDGSVGQNPGYIYFTISIPNSNQVTVKAFVARTGWRSSSVVSATYGFYANQAPALTDVTTTIGGNVLHVLTNPINYTYRDNDDGYKSLVFNALPPDSQSTVYYRFQTTTSNGNISGNVSDWIQIPSNGNFSITKTIVPTVAQAKLFNQDAAIFTLSIIFKVTKPGFFDMIGTGSIQMNYRFPSISFQGDGSNQSFDNTGYCMISNPSFALIDPGSPSTFGMVFDALSLVVDDIRYAELAIKGIMGGAVLQFQIDNFTLAQNGTMTAPDSTTTNTGLVWGQGSVIRIQNNLLTGGFKLAIDTGAWVDFTTNPQLSVGDNTMVVLFGNPTAADPVGTAIQFNTRASQFKYAIPTGLIALDNFND